MDLLLLSLEFVLPPKLGTILGEATIGLPGLIIAPGKTDKHEDVVCSETLLCGLG